MTQERRDKNLTTRPDKVNKYGEHPDATIVSRLVPCVLAPRGQHRVTLMLDERSNLRFIGFGCKRIHAHAAETLGETTCLAYRNRISEYIEAGAPRYGREDTMSGPLEVLKSFLQEARHVADVRLDATDEQRTHRKDRETKATVAISRDWIKHRRSRPEGYTARREIGLIFQPYLAAVSGLAFVVGMTNGRAQSLSLHELVVAIRASRTSWTTTDIGYGQALEHVASASGGCTICRKPDGSRVTNRNGEHAGSQRHVKQFARAVETAIASLPEIMGGRGLDLDAARKYPALRRFLRRGLQRREQQTRITASKMGRLFR